MSETTIRIPTVGRQIHFFPVTEQDVAVVGYNNVSPAPATVVQVFGSLHANISILTMNPDAPIVQRLSVQHKSLVVTDPDGNPGGSYWDWPEVK